MNPVDLIGAHPWRSATFTTYALSLAFFESIVLDALVRGGSRSALILSDLEGVRASLSEKGVRRAGREYEVEPVSVAHGVFHPKITVLHSDDDCHLLVGSGNLTFGGWGGNLEVLEHLHPSFAADAFHDVADFFEGMATSAELRHGVSDRCLEVARQLRSSVATYPRNGDIRVLHSIGSSIADQIVKLAADLGGATRLLVVSPFWDSGEAVDRLAGRLELDEVFVHSHPGGCVEGRAGSNWPREKLRRAVPVRLAVFGEDNPRRLHGKVFEVSCKRGRLLVSGSANATAAALEGRGNVEASVVRIQHDGAAWEFAAAQPPLPNLGDEDGEEEVSVKAGVLRAVLDSDQLVGEVFAPRLSGEAFALRVSTVGSVSLGRVVIGKDYRFVMSAPGLEVESWKGARIVLRLEWSTGESAEGYVSVAAFTEIQRRAGVMVSRLLALLSGTETPADVAAIFSWFHENPDRLRRSFGEAKGSRADDDSTTTGGDATVAVDELNIAHAVGLRLDGSAATASGSGWARFIDQLLSSLRERGGPASGASIDSSEDDDDDDDADDSKSEERARSDRENTKAFVSFVRLSEALLEPKFVKEFAADLFDLTIYVCARLELPRSDVLEWLTRSTDAVLKTHVRESLRQSVAAAILVLQSLEPGASSALRARRRFLNLGLDVSGDLPPMKQADLFGYLFPVGLDVASNWRAVQAVRTPQELVSLYWRALRAGTPNTEYQELQSLVPKEWPVLSAAFVSPRSRARLTEVKEGSEMCPKCYRALPLLELHKLRDYGLATASNCCGNVLVVEAS